MALVFVGKSDRYGSWYPGVIKDISIGKVGQQLAAGHVAGREVKTIDQHAISALHDLHLVMVNTTDDQDMVVAYRLWVWVAKCEAVFIGSVRKIFFNFFQGLN